MIDFRARFRAYRTRQANKHGKIFFATVATFYYCVMSIVNITIDMLCHALCHALCIMSCTLGGRGWVL